MTRSEKEKELKDIIFNIQSSGDREKKEMLIMDVLDKFEPFRRSLAKKFAGKGVDFDDVCQVIDLKLIEAMYDYDENLDSSAIRHITSKARNGIFNFYKKEMDYFKEDRKKVSIDQPYFYVSHNGHNVKLETSNILDYYIEDNFDEDKIIDMIVLEQELENLTDHQRELIHMYYWSDMKQDEIADELQIHQTNVSRATKRGVKKLKENLNPLDEQGYKR
ncbi:MAG: sigma-70 family RNA polymerase sigma factor [Psychrobacillus sp.]